MQSKAVLLRVRETSIKSWSKKKKRFTGPSILRLSVRPVFHGKASECEHEEMLLEQFNVILLLLLLLHTCVVLCHDNTTLETPGTHFIFVSVGSTAPLAACLRFTGTHRNLVFFWWLAGILIQVRYTRVVRWGMCSLSCRPVVWGSTDELMW